MSTTTRRGSLASSVARRDRLFALKAHGPWLNVKELLDWLEKKRPKMYLGVQGISHYPSKELVGKYATFEGRPVIGIDKAPPRLYHRTLKDAAFNILQEGMIAGYGGSGKLHNYFAKNSERELE